MMLYNTKNIFHTKITRYTVLCTLNSYIALFMEFYIMSCMTVFMTFGPTST